MNPGMLDHAAPPAEDWPELVKLDAPKLPRLDLDLLPDWVGNFARALAEDTETPPELAAGMVLAACAAAAARRLRVAVTHSHSEPCNLWLVVALAPGNRKSAVQGAAAKPLVDWERERAATMAPEINRAASERKTQEILAKEIRGQAAKEKDPTKRATLAQNAADIEAALTEVPVMPRLWTSDATPEQLGTLMAEQGECLAWLSSEGGIFDLLQGRYSRGIPNLDLVLKAHSGDPDRVDRGGRPPVFLRRPRLTIGLCVQPDVLRGLAETSGFRSRGLLGRFLYLLPPSPLGYRKLQPPPFPEQTRAAFAAGLRATLEWPPAQDDGNGESCHLLRLVEDAHAEWLAFARAIEEQMKPGEKLEHCTDWAGKAPGALARLAGVLHGIRHAHGKPWETPIDAETMTAARGIMEVFVDHTVSALDLMGADPGIAAARSVWSWIERNRRARFCVRDAFNALRGSFPRMGPLLEALAVLEERGYLMVVKHAQNGPGRPPSPLVNIRPDIARTWR